MYKKGILLLGVLILVILLSGCSFGSYVTINSSEHNTASSMAMSYEKFNGFKSRTVRLEKAATISVDIVSDAGLIDLSIDNEDGNSVYEGTGIPTSSFAVHVDEGGDYKITLKADNHKGGYDLSWGFPDKESKDLP